MIAGVGDFDQFLIDVDHWTSVHFSAVRIVEDGRHTHNDCPDENGPIHGHCSDGLDCREEGHDECECYIKKGYNVERNGKFAKRESAWRQWLAPETLEKNAANGDEIAGEERGDEQADDGVESGSGSNVDQGETKGNG